MAASVNKVIIVGNLGADPEVRYTPAGQACCKMRVATSYQSRSQDPSAARQERTDWHKVVAWGKTAELCKQYLSKGRSVYVEGHLKHDRVEGKDGAPARFFTEVVGERVVFLGGGRGGEGGGGGGGSSTRSEEPGDSQEEVSQPTIPAAPISRRARDDLPF